MEEFWSAPLQNLPQLYSCVEIWQVVERAPSPVHYKPNKIKDMEKYIKVKEEPISGNDCNYCALKNVCAGDCGLPYGYHYEKVYIK